MSAVPPSIQRLTRRGSGTGWGSLVGLLFLAVAGLASGQETVRSLAALRALPSETAVRRLPVEVSGVVLYADPATGDLMIDDGTACCYCYRGAMRPEVKVGDRVRVQGRSTSEGLFPHAVASSLVVLGQAERPPPHLLAPDEIFLPAFDSTWIEVPAIVMGAEPDGLAYTLVVEVFGQTFKADVPRSPDAPERAAALMQRPVRMRAILATVFNRHRQMTGRHFLVPSFDDLVATGPTGETAPARPRKVAEMLAGTTGPDDLVRIEGVVTQGSPRGFNLRDETGSTLVLTPLAGGLRPGARVLVDGYGAIFPFQPALRATRVEQVGGGEAPPPRPLDLRGSDLALMHMEYVSMEAEVLGLRGGVAETMLQCRAGPEIFDVVLPLSAGNLPPLNPGDRIRATGICELTTNHPLPRTEWINGFRILLAGPDQIAVLHRAPWWTTRRLLTALAMTSGAAFVATLGVIVLRRQVNRQGTLLGAKLRDEAVSQERERLARDLHDTLEQQLTGVSMQLESLANSPHPKSPVVADRLALASRMLQHSREEARRSVWELRSQMLESHGLAAALRDLAAAAAIDGGPGVEARVDEVPAILPTAVEYALLRMAQEALANALKHARARRIVISLAVSEGQLVLAVTDDGAGFDPNQVNPDKAPHFGLIGLRERAGKIGARLEIETQPGSGCRIRVTLPLPSAPP